MRDESTKELREAFLEFAKERNLADVLIFDEQIPGIMIDFKHWCKNYEYKDLMQLEDEA